MYEGEGAGKVVGVGNDEHTPGFSFTQWDENDIAEMVVLNEPALANWMGSIHPNGSLYERPLNVAAAQAEHMGFRRELEKNGCIVMTVREILLKDVDTDVVARVKLEGLAFGCITYVLNNPARDQAVLTPNDLKLLSDEYKQAAIDKMNASQLVEIVLTNPTIYLEKADKDTELLAVNYSFQPLVNLVFCRDQQITTGKGVVIANLSSPIRERETKVMKFCFEKLGVPVVGHVPSPGKLEGGDFFPVGADLCMVGVGLRSNMYAIQYLMDNDLVGTTRVAVVKDYFDQDQQRMHLDTVFNILRPRCALILDNIMGESSPRRRLVDEYTRNDDGKYVLSRHDIEFVKYVTENHYTLIPVSEANQFDYGCNGVNLGNGNLIMVDRATAKVLARNKHFDGKITVIDFRNMTDMFGSVHCCSQVISRRRSSGVNHGPEQATRLCKAAGSGDLEGLRRLAASGIDLSLSDYDGRTALHLAASEGKSDIVRFLIKQGASVNVVDRWDNTPLDDAIRHSRGDVIDLLKRLGGKNGPQVKEEKEKLEKEAFEKLAADSAQTKKRNKTLAHQASTGELREMNSDKRSNYGAHRGVMVVPSNFDQNTETASGNILMKNSYATKAAMTSQSGRREMRTALLRSHEALHRMLTVDLGVEVYLFKNEDFENCPEATFVADWFSTHSADECGVSTLILYPMMAANRRTERNPFILKALTQIYSRVINLTHCEQGVLEATEQVDGTIDTTLTPAGRFLEAGAISLDRKFMTAYIGFSDRAHNEVIDLWEKVSGYKVIRFKTHPLEGSIVSHTTSLLFLGTGYAMIATDLIVEEDRERVLASLRDNKYEIISLKPSQIFEFAAQLIEVPNKQDKPVLLTSTAAYKSYTEEQRSTLLKYVAEIQQLDLSALEALGGASLFSLYNKLY